MKTNRRGFLSGCAKAGFGCCALMYAPHIFAAVDDKPDPKKMNYCGYTCTPECPLYQATTENNSELKKKAYDAFKMKEKFGVEFDPDKIFCWGCKTDKPLGMSVTSCTVRKCALEKKYDACIQCPDLVTCNKELWTSYPKFKEKVIEMQKKYNA